MRQIDDGSRKSGPSKKELRLKREALQKEVMKLKERREEREEEREEMERLKLEEARLREQSMYGDWEKKEEMFHLEQSRRRTKMRIDDGRERPIIFWRKT